MKNILKNCFVSRIVMLCAIVLGISTFGTSPALAGGGDTYEVAFWCANGDIALKPDGTSAMYMVDLDDPKDFPFDSIIVPTTCDGQNVLSWKSGNERSLIPDDITGGYIYYRFVDMGDTSVALYPDTYEPLTAGVAFQCADGTLALAADGKPVSFSYGNSYNCSDLSSQMVCDGKYVTGWSDDVDVITHNSLQAACEYIAKYPETSIIFNAEVYGNAASVYTIHYYDPDNNLVESKTYLSSTNDTLPSTLGNYTVTGWEENGNFAECMGASYSAGTAVSTVIADIIEGDCGKSLKLIATGATVTPKTHTITLVVPAGCDIEENTIEVDDGANISEIFSNLSDKNTPECGENEFIGFFDCDIVNDDNCDPMNMKNYYGSVTYDFTVYGRANVYTYDCDVGYYLPANSTECKKCESGYYCGGVAQLPQSTSPQGRNQCTAPYNASAEGSDGSEDCYVTLTAGKYIAVANGSLATCPAGSYCPGGSKIYYGNTGGSTKCAAGSYSAANASTCTPCSNGKTSVAGASSCNLSCSNTANVATWKTATWNNNTVTNACTIDTCASGYTLYNNQCSLANYTITYNLNGGKNNINNPVNYGMTSATITLLAPSKTGYTFGGWYTTSNFTGSAVSSIPTGSTGNKTFYAKWTANKITVDYNEYGGAAIANGSCNYDGTLTLPTTSPVRDGFTFNGWLMADGTVQKTGSVACNSTKLGVTSGTASNITAQWTLSEVTIIYTIGSNFSKEIKYSPTSTETIPMKFTDGNITYNVTTWTEGSIEGVGDCGAFDNFGSGKTVKSLVDAWLDGCGSNKIPLDAYAYTQICPAGTYLNNGICTACAQNSYSAAGASACTPCPGGKLTSGTGSTTCDKSCTNPNADKVTAWNAATWNQSTNTVTGTCSIKSCQTGYVNQSGSCSLQSYTVQYSCGDATGTAPAKTTVPYGQEFTPAATPGTCTKPGYEFAGWQTTDNSGATVTKPGGTPYAWTYTASKTLTAQWTKTCYEIELEYGPVGNLRSAYIYKSANEKDQLYVDVDCTIPLTSDHFEEMQPNPADGIPNGSILRFENSDGDECLTYGGGSQFDYDESCSVTGDAYWYAVYQCAAGYTRNGDTVGSDDECRPECYEIELVPSSDYHNLDLVWAEYGLVTEENFYDDSACDSHLQGAYVEKYKSNATWLGYTMNGVPLPNLTELPDDYFCTSEESYGMPTGNCFIESDTTWISIYECDEGFRANGKYVDYDTPCTASTYAITLDAGVGTGLNITKIYAKPGFGWYSDAAAGAGDKITSVTMPYSNQSGDDWLFMGFFTGQNGSGTQVISKNGNIVAPDFMFEGPATVYAYYEKCTCTAGDGVDRCVPTADSEGATCTYQVTCKSGYNKRGSFGTTTFTESGDAHVLNTELSCVSSNARTGYVCPPDSSYYTSCYEGKYMAVKDASGNYAYNGTPQSGNSCETCPGDAAYCPGGTSAPLYAVYLVDSVLGQYGKIYGNFNTEYYTCESVNETYECTPIEGRLPEDMIPYDSHPDYTFNGFADEDGNVYIDADGNFKKSPSSSTELRTQWSLNCYEIDLDPYSDEKTDSTGIGLYIQHGNWDVMHHNNTCTTTESTMIADYYEYVTNAQHIGYIDDLDKIYEDDFEPKDMLCINSSGLVTGNCEPTSNETWYPVYRCNTGYTANGVYVDVNGICSESVYTVGISFMDCDTAPDKPESCSSNAPCVLPDNPCSVPDGWRFKEWRIKDINDQEFYAKPGIDIREYIEPDAMEWVIFPEFMPECYKITLDNTEEVLEFWGNSMMWGDEYYWDTCGGTLITNNDIHKYAFPLHEIPNGTSIGYYNETEIQCIDEQGHWTYACESRANATWHERFTCDNADYVVITQNGKAECVPSTMTILYGYDYGAEVEATVTCTGKEPCYLGCSQDGGDWDCGTPVMLKDGYTLAGFNVIDDINPDAGTEYYQYGTDITGWATKYEAVAGEHVSFMLYAEPVWKENCHMVSLWFAPDEIEDYYIKETNATQLFSDSMCSSPISSFNKGVHLNGSFVGYYSPNGILCIDSDGTLTGNCVVTNEEEWWAGYNCNVGYHPSDNDDDIVEPDIQCNPNIYTVDFDKNGGAGEMPGQPFTYDVAQNLTTNAFTRDGYAFAGWNTASDGSGTDYDDKALISNLLEDITLYAQWKLNTYDITYNLGGGENSDSNPSSYTVEDTVVLQPAEKTGFRFVGWFDDAGNQITQIAKGTTGEINLNAQWSETAYVIKYENMTGAVNNPNNKNGYNVTTETFDLYAPTKTGYDFGGWYDNENLTGTAVTQIETGSTGDKTFWAKWTATVYTCNSGEYLNVTECTLCPEGAKCPTTQFTYNAEVQGLIACAAASEYQDQTGQIVCKTVNDGYVANDEHTEQTECGENYWCKGGIRTQCIGDGVTGTTTASDATQCHLNAVACSDAGGRGTQNCNYNPNTGKYDDCEPCDFNMCNDGYYKNDTTCVICPVGSWCANNQQNACPEGYLTTTTGASAQTQCFVKCQNKEVEYGMAFADNAQEFWPSVCTHTKGTSATGNPCDIINNVCVETSCNYNYEMKGSKCVECVRDNALSFKEGSDNCVVDSCEVGYYPYGKQCMAATRECTPTANAVSAQQAWNTKTNSYDICVITQCADGYHLTDNRCVANEQTCVLAHGTGVQTWNVSLNRWNDCTATSCNPGYTNDPYLTDDDTWEQCGRCNNMFDDKNQIAVSSYSRECEIAACLYQGQKYILENNECRSICDEKTDETGHRYFKNGKCVHDCESGYMEW